MLRIVDVVGAHAQVRKPFFVPLGPERSWHALTDLRDIQA